MSNQAANAGDNISFNCTQDGVKSSYLWYLYYDHSNNVYIDGKSEPFNLSADNSQLYIRPLDFGYGAYYECIMTSTTSKTFAAAIVIGKDLECTLSTLSVDVNNTIEVNCNDSCSGQAIPRVTCNDIYGALKQTEQNTSFEKTVAENTYAPSTPYETSYNYSVYQFNSWWTFEAQSGVPNAVIQCELAFTNPPEYAGQQNAEDNIPSYTSTWTSPQVTIYYPPENLTISPDENILPVGTNVTCYANANPPATFQWTEVYPETANISDDAMFETTSDMNGTYKCTATNMVGGLTYRESLSTNITTYSVPCGDGSDGTNCQNGTKDAYPGAIAVIVLILLAIF